jgi:hypothetical protein
VTVAADTLTTVVLGKIPVPEIGMPGTTLVVLAVNVNVYEPLAPPELYVYVGLAANVAVTADVATVKFGTSPPSIGSAK